MDDPLDVTSHQTWTRTAYPLHSLVEPQLAIFSLASRPSESSSSFHFAGVSRSDCFDPVASGARSPRGNIPGLSRTSLIPVFSESHSQIILPHRALEQLNIGSELDSTQKNLMSRRSYRLRIAEYLSHV